MTPLPSFLVDHLLFEPLFFTHQSAIYKLWMSQQIYQYLSLHVSPCLIRHLTLHEYLTASPLNTLTAFGTHYCDITGETDWVRDMIDKHDAAAKASGARIVHFCGHDCVPWDLAGNNQQSPEVESRSENLIPIISSILSVFLTLTHSDSLRSIFPL